MKYHEINSININGVLLTKSSIVKVRLDAEISHFLTDWFDEKDHLIAQTSGSTGTPKLISIQKQQMVNSAITTLDYLHLNKEKLISLLCLPTKYIGGKMMMVRAMVAKHCLLTLKPNSSPSIPDLKIDFAAFTPHQISNIVNSQNKHHLNKIKNIIIGGGKVNHTLEKSLESINSNIYETFGMTETVSHFALRKIGSTYFNVLPPSHLVESKNQTLKINSPHLGIKNLETNDIIEKKDELSFKWLGRKDFIINSGGVKIIPEIIESELSKDLNSKHFFIGKMPDDKLGEICIICYEKNILKEEKINHAIKKIDSILRPKKIIPISKIIYTANGKIDRQKSLKKLII